MSLPIVPLGVWRALFRAYGVKRAPASLDDARARIAEADGVLAAAVRSLTLLGNDAGRRALVEAARALGVPMRDWPRSVGAAELAATLVTRAAKDMSLAKVIEAASHRARRAMPEVLTRRYVVQTGRAPDSSRKALAKLAALLTEANLERLADGAVEVRLVTKSPLVLDVVRPEPVVCALRLSARGDVEMASWTPVTIDQVAIERRGDGIILRVLTPAVDFLEAYRRAIGAALFGDPELLLRARAVSLCNLQRRGRDALDVRRIGGATLKGARVIAAHWDSGLEETNLTRGRDVLAALDRDALARRGALVASTIRLDFTDGPLDAILRAPNLVHWERGPRDDAMEAFLGSLGVDDDARDDFLSLALLRSPARRWKAALGERAFDALDAAGLFARTTSRAIEHPDAPGAGRIALAFPLDKGRAYAVPEEGFDVAARVVSDEELVTYQLDLVKLGARVAGGMQLHGEPRPLEHGALVDLGERAIGAARVRAFLVCGALVERGLADRLRVVAREAHALLVVPGDASSSIGGVACVALDAIEGPYTPLVAAAARVLGVEEELDLCARAPAGTRVVIERATNRVWLDGVELTAMADSARQFARVLVDAGGGPLPSKECDARLSTARVADGAAKQAKARFVKGIRASFEASGRAPPEDAARIIEATKGGYRISVAWWMG